MKRMKRRTPETNGVKELLVGAGFHVGSTGQIPRPDRLHFGDIPVPFPVLPMARETIGQVEFFTFHPI
jgi:hypothetical protein